MADEKEVTIVIKGRNLSGPEFESARRQIAGLKDESTRAKGANDAFGASFRSLAGFASTFGVALGAGAIVSYAQDILNAAGATVDLSNKTGLSIDTIQRMAHVADQTGASTEQLADSAYKLGLNLSGGSGSVQEGVRKLGLSYQELMSLSPDEQFHRVVGALEQMEDPQQRNTVAVQLFGKSASAILPAIADGYSKIASETTVAGDEQVRALDKAGDAISKFKKDIGAGLTQAMGSVAQALMEIERGADSMTLKQKAGLAVSTLWGKSYLGELREVGKGLMAAEEAQEKQTQSVRNATPPVLSFSAQLAKTREEVNRLTADQRRQIDAARDLGVSTSDITAQFGISAGALRLLGEDTKKAEESARKKAAEVQKAKEAQDKWLASIKATTTELVPYRAAIQDAGSALQNIAAGFEADGSLLSRSIHEAGTAASEADREMQEWARTNGATLAPSIEATGAAIEEATDKTVRWGDQLGELAQSLSQMAQVSGDSFGGVLKWLASVVTSMDAAQKAGTGMRAGFMQLSGENRNLAAGLSQIATSALAAGAAFLQATGQGNTFQRMLGGVAAGAQIGSAFGPWGTAIGAAAGAVTGLIRGIFGVSEAVKQARTEVDGFQRKLEETLTATQRQEAGNERWKMTVIAVRDAYLATGRTAADAEAIVRQLWDTDHPDRARAAMQTINGVLDEHKQKLAANAAEQERLTGELKGYEEELAGLRGEGEITWQKMQEAAQRYGVDLASLGPKFQSGRLHETAQQIWNDFVLLTRGGADVGGVLLGMKDEILNLAGESVRFGTQIPANFRPLIDNLIESNELTEEEKNKLRALGAENFGDPVVAKLDVIATRMGELITKIGEITDRLARNVPQAADAGARGLENMRDRGRAAMEDLGAAIREEVIEMHSPTGLEGVRHYALLAADGLSQIARVGLPTMLTLGQRIAATTQTTESLGRAASFVVRGFEEIEIDGVRTMLEVQRVGDAAAEAFRGKWVATLDSLIPKMKEFSGAIPYKTIEDEKDEDGKVTKKNPMAGFVDPNIEFYSEAEAIARLKQVGAFYGRSVADGDLASFAAAYKYGGQGKVAKGRFEEFLKDFAKLMVEETYAGFSTGTGGQFLNFGAGQPVMLHGREAVVPYEQRVPTAKKWLGESGAAATPVIVYVCVNKDGTISASSEGGTVQVVQRALDEGRLRVPQRNIARSAA